MKLVDEYVVQNEGYLTSDMNGEKVMLCVANGKYYNLGEIGGVIWDLIRTPVNIDQIVDNLINQYEVSSEECKAQVINFLNHLLEEGLIKIDSFAKF